MGQSPQAFLMTYRMISATDMLLYTKMSIAEIGKLVGYENQLHFSRAFKNYYGVSPM
jgi:AraC-like DNA-binding protein